MRRWAPAMVLAALLVAGCGHEAPRKAPLVQGPESFSEHEALIEQRLAARWPVGASSAGLDAYLRGQGFKVRRPNARYSAAELRWGGLVHGREARIYWRMDERGTMTELDVVVQSSGLLGGIEDL